MKLIASMALVVLVAAPLGFAKDKKKKDLPEMLATARYVYVQAEDGDIMNPRLFPEDRQAIADVQDELKNWNRYTVTINRDEAELMVVVRKGRLAGAQAGGGVGIGSGPALGGSYPGDRNPAGPNNPGGGPMGGPGGGVSTEVGVRGEAGPSDDLLRVYIVGTDGKRGAMLWSREMRDGLDAPQELLVRQLKQEVDKAYPPQTANQQPPAPKKP